MSLNSLFYPSSLLLISDDDNFKTYVIKNYKKQLISEKEIKKFDLLIVDVSGKKILETIKRYGKYAKTILITKNLSKELKKKVYFWSKRNKKQIINARIYVPFSLDTLNTEIEKPKKGGIAAIVEYEEYSDFWLDLFSKRNIGVSFFVNILDTTYLEEIIKYLLKSEEVKGILLHLKESIEFSGKAKKPIFNISRYHKLEDVLYDIYASMMNVEKPKPRILFLANGYRYISYNKEEISKNVKTKIKKYITKITNTNFVDLGVDSTVETIKKLVLSLKKDFDLFVIIFNPYVSQNYEDFMYGLAVLANEGVKMIVYVPGGRKSEEIVEKLRSFSIPSFTMWYEVERLLERFGRNV